MTDYQSRFEGIKKSKRHKFGYIFFFCGFLGWTIGRNPGEVSAVKTIKILLVSDDSDSFTDCHIGT